MLKRLLIVLFVLVFVLSVFAGCQDTTTSGTTAATTTKATTTKPGETTTEPSMKYEFPWMGDPITLTYFYVNFDYAGMIADPNKLIDAEFQKLLGNVTIENQSVGWADYGTRTNLYFASGDLPDILQTGSPDYVNSAGPSGFLLDFSKYLDFMPTYSSLYEKYPQTFRFLDDSIYAIQQCRDTFIMGFEWVANGYYTKQGIPIPKTYDEVYESCKQVKALYPDVYPLNFNWGGSFQVDFNTSKDVFWNNKTQQWEWGLVSEDFKNMIAFQAKMFTEELINPNQFDQVWGDEWISIITDPHAWFLYTGYNEVNDLKVPGMVEKEPTFSVEWMMPPIAPGQNHSWMQIEAQPGGQTYYLYSSANTKDPEFLCAFLDFMLSDQVGVLLNWGVEDVTYIINDDGEKEYHPDLIIPARPNQGTIDSVKDLSLYPHFMCKQLGCVTRNDFDAMYAWHSDATCNARMARYKEYVNDNPEHARWIQPKPNLTTAEARLVSSLLTDINTYADEQIALFRTGRRSMNEWDNFITEVKSIGDGQLIADLYNEKPQIVLVND